MSNYFSKGADSTSIPNHLTILQGIISRMAANSAMCKAWCVTLVSAILVIIADKGKTEFALLAILPCIMFALLDAFYLGLERGFRDNYKAFVKKAYKNDTIPVDDYADIKPIGSKKSLTWRAFWSFSVLGMYGFLIVLILVAKYVALSTTGNSLLVGIV